MRPSASAENCGHRSGRWRSDVEPLEPVHRPSSVVTTGRTGRRPRPDVGPDGLVELVPAGAGLVPAGLRGRGHRGEASDGSRRAPVDSGPPRMGTLDPRICTPSAPARPPHRFEACRVLRRERGVRHAAGRGRRHRAGSRCSAGSRAATSGAAARSTGPPRSAGSATPTSWAPTGRAAGASPTPPSWPTPSPPPGPPRPAAAGRPLVVCTGGEPLLQLDEPLVAAFHDRGFEVAIETNGTLPAPPGHRLGLRQPQGRHRAGADRRATSSSWSSRRTASTRARSTHLAFGRFSLSPMDGPDRDGQHRPGRRLLPGPSRSGGSASRPTR